MYNKKLVVVTAILVIAFSVIGCSSPKSAMDFSDLDLKKPDPLPGEYPSILFVGNSHTYTNDMPDIFAEVAYSMGHEADVYSLTEGSYSLADYTDTNDELGAELDSALSGLTWDFVILQDNTNSAFADPDQSMLPAAEALNEKIKAAGGQTALLMTWSPKEGLKNGSLNLSKEEVQSILAENYIETANELDALLIPAGAAFMVCNEKYPDIELWDEDGAHPSVNGSYLTALTAFAVIYQQSPAGCENVGVDEATAEKLQEIAEQVVLG